MRKVDRIAARQIDITSNYCDISTFSLITAVTEVPFFRFTKRITP